MIAAPCDEVGNGLGEGARRGKGGLRRGGKVVARGYDPDII